MKQILLLVGTAALGVVVGALLVLILARSASKLYLESEDFIEDQRMFSRAVDYEREGDLQKAYALYFAGLNRLDERASAKRGEWEMAFPLFYPVLAKMKEATDYSKGSRAMTALHRATFGHLLERLGRSEEAYEQYSIAAKSVGVDVEIMKKRGRAFGEIVNPGPEQTRPHQ